MEVEQKLLSLQLSRTRKQLSDTSNSNKRKEKPHHNHPFTQWCFLNSKMSAKDACDPNEDLQRELVFYQQALEAAKESKALVLKEGLDFHPPEGYVPLMIKTSEHMDKVAKKIQESEQAQKEKEEAKRQRSLKKFGKQVQASALKKQEMAKKQALKDVENEFGTTSIKKKNKKQNNNTNYNDVDDDNDEFGIEIDNEEPRRRHDKKKKTLRPSLKREERNARFGFGGKKKDSKRNTKESSADDSSFNLKRNKKPFPGMKKRPGKEKRLQIRNRKASRSK